ncbi:hypothetical protein GCM10009544_22560 [Streptomyces stramineus]|uniref:Uncharacterized protein n=1 Tax=Streptomyces stramineus TaxID=173861 RepID=A0ABP3JNH9_9ACTN
MSAEAGDPEAGAAPAEVDGDVGAAVEGMSGLLVSGTGNGDGVGRVERWGPAGSRWGGDVSAERNREGPQVRYP